MQNQINVQDLINLRIKELGPDDSHLVLRMETASQSIHRWLQYCSYHYFNLTAGIGESDLRLDRALELTRKDENVKFRFVYEANIIGFLNSLHALSDAFPYLLNLVIPKFDNPDSASVRWSYEFVKRFQSYGFKDELFAFMLNPTFNIVKSYVNTTKHKHLIRIANTYDNLEFEDFVGKLPSFDKVSDKVAYHVETIPRQDVIKFLGQCHDELVPLYIDLIRAVMKAKTA